MFRLETKNRNKSNTELINKLGQISKLEYSLIVSYPQLARQIKDRETQDLVLSLGTASISHYDVVARALTKLGGTPTFSLELLPIDKDLVQIFTEQLGKENLALELHTQCTYLTKDLALKEELASISNEEKSHIKTVEKILFKLNQELTN
jgi:bacterioferritin (cytochrome b1)